MIQYRVIVIKKKHLQQIFKDESAQNYISLRQYDAMIQTTKKFESDYNQNTLR